MRITALERRPKKRLVELFVDGQLAAVLSPEVCARFDFRVGGEINLERLEEARRVHALHTALGTALRLLARRPRSEREVRQRLFRKGLPGEAVDATVRRLRELRLVDDEAFSASWVESRERTSPRGRRLLAAELVAQGVERGTAARAAAAVDERAAADRAAGSQARALASLPWPDFRRRLHAFLLRRGFDSETAMAVVRDAWVQATGGRPPGEHDV